MISHDSPLTICTPSSDIVSLVNRILKLGLDASETKRKQLARQEVTNYVVGSTKPGKVTHNNYSKQTPPTPPQSSKGGVDTKRNIDPSLNPM